MKPNKFIIEKQVSAFRTDNGLSASEPVTLKSLLLKLNILTVFRPLSDNFSGMCLKDNSGHRFMLINSNQPRGRQHFTIAHELYHLFIEEKPTPHKCNPGYSKNFVEQSADMFASLLLMPESGICQLVPENELKTKSISMATILKLEHYFSVSRSALLYRLLNIGLISESTRSQFAEVGVKTLQNVSDMIRLYTKLQMKVWLSVILEKKHVIYSIKRKFRKAIIWSCSVK